MNIALSPSFSPTWDFPEHLSAGLIRLGMAAKPADYQYLPYGYINDALPILFSRLFPASWFPTSYNLFSVVIGCIGIIFFYWLVKDGFGKKVALLSSITLFLLPRFIGYLHVDIKDSVIASFLIITAFFFNRYLTRRKIIYAIFSVLFYACAVNTKITALQFYPVLVVWMLFDLLHEKHMNKSKVKKTPDYHMIGYFCILFLLLFVPVLIFFLLWPASINDFITVIKNVNASIIRLPYSANPFYALEQLFITTPLPVLAFVPFGIWVCLHKKNSLPFFLCFLFFWTFIKYPLLRQPVIDNVRYFLEVFYPLAVFFVLGVEWIGRKYALRHLEGGKLSLRSSDSFQVEISGKRLAGGIYLGVFLYLTCLFIAYHPYQINYYNALAVNRDPDFWASSYKEAIGYVNQVAPKGAVVSCRMADLLARYYLRPDLWEKLNTKPPEESEVVVVLNRPSLFPLFRLSEYYERNKPRKVITDRSGTPLTLIYYK